MEDFDFTVDFRFAEVEFELWAAAEYLNTLECELPRLIAQYEKLRLAQVQERDAEDDAEYDLALQESYAFEDVLPRYFRGSFVVTLWAIFESAFTEAARYLRRHANLELGLKDIRGDDSLDQAVKYFEHVLHFPFIPDTQTLNALKRLLIIRNAYAHANGRVSVITDHTQNQIRSWQRENVGISITRANSSLVYEPSLRGALFATKQSPSLPDEIASQKTLAMTLYS